MSSQVFHAPLITTNPRMRLTRVVRRRGSGPLTSDIPGATERYADVAVVTDVADLLAASDVDLVVIATPSGTHYDLTRQALEAGKHVVVEKPFVPTAKEADDLVKLANRLGLVLSVFHNRRWDSDFRTVARLIMQHQLGSLVEYESHYDRYRGSVKKGAWREESGEGSGILYDLGSHLIDQTICLFGE